MPKPVLERRWPWVTAAGVILLVFFSTMIEIRLPGDWDPRPPGRAEDIGALRDRDDVNVLFILIDTLRAERLSAYGYERETSPALDRLAASGVRFARHLAQSSWTKCSMASLWTALYPTRAGITRFDEVLPPTARMPAEVLAEAGFRTAGIYRNGWVAPSFGFDQGFEVYRRPGSAPLPADVRRKNPTLSDRSTDEGLVLNALEFLRIHGRERWFLYLHLMDVHEYLFTEETALFGTRHADSYDNSVRHTDHVVQVLLEYLAADGYLENTVIAVASDHGEAFGERGYDGHAREVFRETTEVPFLLAFPFKLDAGITVQTRTRNVDIWPTLLDLLGLQMPEDVDGRSLVPEILAAARGEEPGASDGRAIAHLDQTWSRPELEPRPTIAVTEGELRYVRLEGSGDEPIERLFDGRDDPAEMRDRAEERPEAVERLREVADAYLAAEPAWGASPTRELDELELNHLRALGYAIP